MYIAPNSTIRIINTIPFNSLYRDTIYFDSKDDQQAYFQNKTKYIVNKCSYVRENTIKVQIKADNLNNCNYLAFLNTAYGTKWFYAFINKVRYINDTTSEIEYEIDVLQTWHFDYTLRNCFVEREHSKADTYAYQAVAENFDLGDSYICEKQQDFDLSDMSVAMLVSQYSDESLKTVGQVFNGVFSRLGVTFGVNGKQFALNDSSCVQALNDEIDKYVEKGKSNAILQLYQYPTRILKRGGSGSVEPYTESIQCLCDKVQTVDGYAPRNLKLLNYPYKFLRFSNNMGTQNILKYENFTTQAINFYLQGVVMTKPNVMLSPQNYLNESVNYDMGISITNFPACAFSNDAYQEWINNNQNATVTSTVTSALLGLGGGLASANPVVGLATAGAGIASNVANLVAKQQDIKNQSSSVSGAIQADCLLTGTNRFGYSFYRMSIKNEIAKVIDDYFDKFGYASHRLKTPNRKVRESWTYTKTVGASINGRVPNEDMLKICDIYDKGITFWVNGKTVGDYSVSNNPIT